MTRASLDPLRDTVAAHAAALRLPRDQAPHEGLERIGLERIGLERVRATDGEPIPAPIEDGIRAAAIEPFSLLIACRILVEDMTESGYEAQVAEGRLERAVARATLDAWLHGLGSAMSVGLAYAAVGNCVRRTLHGA